MKTAMIFAGLLAGLGTIAPATYAEAEGVPTMQKKLAAEYKLTKTTADKSAIVNAGPMVVLQKDNLLMLAATSINPCRNTYKDGRITQNMPCKLMARSKKVASRQFVAGEKFWVTRMDVRDSGKDQGLMLEFYSDTFDDVHYGTTLWVPFGGAAPSPDDALKLVQEVITAAPAEDANAKEATPEAQPTAEPAPPAPIEQAPIAEGQTIDQVVAAMGQPLRTAKIGNKEIYFYKDLKVTFVDGKVTDLQ